MSTPSKYSFSLNASNTTQEVTIKNKVIKGTLKIIKEYGFDNIMLQYGKGSIKKSGLYDTVIKSLKDNGIDKLDCYILTHPHSDHLTVEPLAWRKANPDAFKGSAGDLSTILRIAITGRTNTPDLCSIMQVLGKEKCMERIEKMINTIKG